MQVAYTVYKKNKMEENIELKINLLRLDSNDINREETLIALTLTSSGCSKSEKSL